MLKVTFSFFTLICSTVAVLSFPGDLDLSFNTTGTAVTRFGFGTDVAYSTAMQKDGKIVAVGSAAFNNNRDFAVVRYHPDGRLDDTFGHNGIVTTSFGYGNEVALSVAIQADQKIVVVGSTKIGTNEDFMVVRYNSHGTLDYSFGRRGIVVTEFPSRNAIAKSVALQQDGKIVVAGSGRGFTLVRYDQDGALDTDFDFDGIASTEVGVPGSGSANAVVVQADNKIVVGGSAYNQNVDFALVRFESDGSLDGRFGRYGKVLTPVGTSIDSISSLAIQDDGKIIAAGQAFNGYYGDFAVVRYGYYGNLDNAFGTGGKVTTSVGTFSDGASSLAIQPDGKVILAGKTDNGNNEQVALARYHSSGSLDLSFGIDGKVVTATRSRGGVANGVLLESSGKPLVVGYAADQNADFAILRYDSSGNLDLSFGDAGRVYTDIGESGGNWKAVAIQSDDKIVAAGIAWGNSGWELALARYNVDGSLDESFNGDGRVINQIGTSGADVNSIALQTDGKIVVVGSTNVGFAIHMAVARYNTDGSLDKSFAEGGIGVFPVGIGAFRASSVAIQTDGRIVIAGSGLLTSDVDFAILRCNIDGSLDQTFGNNGVVFTPVGVSTDEAKALYIQNDGKILVTGNAFNGLNSDFSMVRYNEDGSLDQSFGNNGKVMTQVGNRNDFASDISILNDGKILVAGYAKDSDNTFSDFAIVRYTANGTLDQTFHRTGRVITQIGSDAILNSLILQEDGKILVAGYSSYFLLGGVNNSTMARYLVNGELDATFRVSSNDYRYGPAGSVVHDFGGHDGFNDIALQRDKKIVAVGSGQWGIMRIARFMGD